MFFTKATRSFIFFLSVTAFMCFVLDHLLCPAWAMAVVASCRRHGRQMGARIEVRIEVRMGAALARTRLRAAASGCWALFRIAVNNGRLASGRLCLSILCWSGFGLRGSCDGSKS